MTIVEFMLWTGLMSTLGATARLIKIAKEQKTELNELRNRICLLEEINKERIEEYL